MYKAFLVARRAPREFGLTSTPAKCSCDVVPSRNSFCKLTIFPVQIRKYCKSVFIRSCFHTLTHLRYSQQKRTVSLTLLHSIVIIKFLHKIYFCVGVQLIYDSQSGLNQGKICGKFHVNISQLQITREVCTNPHLSAEASETVQYFKSGIKNTVWE